MGKTHDIAMVFPDWVWENKYRLGEETRSETFRRVASAVAAAERSYPDNRHYEEAFFKAMHSSEFLPAGRILAGAGADRDVTLVNCFVSGTIEDSMAGIMDALKSAAMTMRAGGGIGMDFSTLRPRGAAVKGLGATSSGPVSFMEMWNSMCGTIMSAGARRGAMMGVLRIDHPDIEELIEAKQTAGRLTNFNVSVAVTETFMQAVQAGSHHELSFNGERYRQVAARDLWDKLLRATYEHSEPGVIFIDRVNSRNRLSDIETICASNPCGEQMLPPHGACVLASINLARLVRDPFKKNARCSLDETRLRELTRLGVRFLDNVIDVSRYPLPEQEVESRAKRRIGLGVTGLANALIMLGVRYGSKDAVTWTRHIMAIIEHEAAEASKALAVERGTYPAWQASHGPKRRNSHVLSIAPTGTISALAGNVSSGIEPVFAFSGARNVLQPDGSAKQLQVMDFALTLAGGEKPPQDDVWVTADELSWREHIDMAAAAQRHIDSAVSKTINLPESITFEEFREVYDYAYASGMKGCTTYRPSKVRGAVLLKESLPAEAAHKAAPAPGGAPNVIHMSEPTVRPAELDGTTYKIKPAGSDHAMYVTITDIEEGGRRRPFEIFLNSKSVDGYAWTVALSRMISAIFRKGGDVAFVAEELKQVFDPRGGHWQDGRYVPSLCASIGEIIERHMRLGKEATAMQMAVGAEVAGGRTCPKCQRPTLMKKEGCDVCGSCDYTKC